MKVIIMQINEDYMDSDCIQLFVIKVIVRKYLIICPKQKDLQEFIDKDTTADEESIFYEEFTSKY